MREFVLAVAVLAVIDPSCRSGPDASRTEPEKAVPELAAADVGADPCSAAALGLRQVSALSSWQPPAGCTPRGAGTSTARSDAELAARLECPAGTAPGVDFSRHALLSVAHTLSPAAVGLIAFDDGKTITLVTRQRSPCPDDPRPMPMNTTEWFLLPAGGERTIAEATCTLPPRCR